MALMRVKPGPKPGTKYGPHLRGKTPREKDEAACISIEKQLDDHRNGRSELSPSQLKAIEIRYSRLRPLLSAVEQTQTDPRDIQDPQQLQAKLKALLDAHPGLLESLVAQNAREANKPTEEQEQRAA